MRKAKSWRFKGNELKYVKQVLDSGFKADADGAFTSRLENLFAKTYRQKFAIAFNSGTSTLHSILLALGCKAGDEVMVPSLTPLMCGLSIHYTGATPVYVEVDQNTFLMDPDDLEAKISSKTRVIMVVHMYGAVCDMDRITRIANKYDIPIIEDCAQCHGGIAANGELAGTLGVAGSWSFENSKHITSGDGGIVTTNNEFLATKIRKIGGLGFKTLSAESGRIRTDRDKLQNPDWERFDSIGYNFRMNQLAAAVALAQIERNNYFIELRKLSGQKYLEGILGSMLLTAQQNTYGTHSSYFTFSTKFNGIDYGISWFEFRKKYIQFGGDGIYSAAKLLYQEPIFKTLKIGKGTTPIAEYLQKRLMNFTTNQSNVKKMNQQVEILMKTRKYFGDV